MAIVSNKACISQCYVQFKICTSIKYHVIHGRYYSDNLLSAVCQQQTYFPPFSCVFFPHIFQLFALLNPTIMQMIRSIFYALHFQTPASMQIIRVALSHTHMNVFSYAHTTFCSFAPVTLTLTLRPWYMNMILKMLVQTKKPEVSTLRLSNGTSQTRQTDTHWQTWPNAVPRCAMRHVKHTWYQE